MRRGRELELAVDRIPKRDRTPVWNCGAGVAGVKEYLGAKEPERFQHHVATLTVEFGQRLICDIAADGEWKKVGGLRSRRPESGTAGTIVGTPSFRVLPRILSEETIKSLAGHVSKLMLERYSDNRIQAKRDAITVLDERNSDAAWTHDWAESKASQKARS